MSLPKICTCPTVPAADCPFHHQDACGSLAAMPCSALALAVAAWDRKRERPDLRLEIAAIIHGDSVAELADNLEYIAARLRETGWTAGSGGGKHSKLVWEMFCKPTDQSEATPPEPQ